MTENKTSKDIITLGFISICRKDLNSYRFRTEKGDLDIPLRVFAKIGEQGLIKEDVLFFSDASDYQLINEREN